MRNLGASAFAHRERRRNTGALLLLRERGNFLHFQDHIDPEGATFHARAALGAFQGFFAQALILDTKSICPFLLPYGKDPHRLANVDSHGAGQAVIAVSA